MGPLIASFLCALPRWRLWQNCHFRHISQIRRFRQLLWAPFTALCFALLAIVAKLSFSPYLPNSPLSPTFRGPPSLLCVLPRSSSEYMAIVAIVIFAIFAKFAAFANFYGAPTLLCALPTFMGPLHCFVFCLVRRLSTWRLWQLSFSPYLPNLPLSPTFMGPLHCFVFCLVGDCSKIVIFTIFAKFAVFANFYGAPILLCALPRWRL